MLLTGTLSSHASNAQVLSAIEAAGPMAVQLPEARTGTRDWVAEGLRMPKYGPSACCCKGAQAKGNREILPRTSPDSEANIPLGWSKSLQGKACACPSTAPPPVAARVLRPKELEYERSQLEPHLIAKLRFPLVGIRVRVRATR